MPDLSQVILYRDGTMFAHVLPDRSDPNHDSSYGSVLYVDSCSAWVVRFAGTYRLENVRGTIQDVHHFLLLRLLTDHQRQAERGDPECVEAN